MPHLSSRDRRRRHRPALEEIADQLLRTGRADPDGARDVMLHTMACKAAIKAGMVSGEQELRVLVDKVQKGEIQFCPHGRPVKVKLSRYELEKCLSGHNSPLRERRTPYETSVY